MPDLTINYSLKTCLTVNKSHYDLEAGLNLLYEINTQGNLRAAARKCGYSYRKAWDIIKQLEQLFGAEAVEMQRGRGAQLSGLGQKLLEIHHENVLFFNTYFSTASEQASLALNTALSAIRKITIIASDSEKLNALRPHQLPLSIKIEGSGAALAAFMKGECEMAGFHITAGKYQLDEYRPFLDTKKDRFIVLEQRRQGLISHPDRPVDSIQQIVDQHLTFVNRQTGSGTRKLLDILLKHARIPDKLINGYYHEEHTHLAVAGVIASKQADCGLGIETVASRLNLHFTPLAREYYFLVFKTLTIPLLQVLNRLDEQLASQILDYSAFIKTLSKQP